MSKQNILIATLGDHPTAITGMVKALREIGNIAVDEVCILYPEEQSKDIAAFGYSLVEEYLRGVCTVISVSLGFPDANTTERSLSFLHILVDILEHYQYSDQNVYLSVAGGRKNMSALMVLVTIFFPAIKGVYHLLSRDEAKLDMTLPSIWQLVSWLGTDKANAAINPPVEKLMLVPIPHPKPFANAVQLREYLKSSVAEIESASLSLTPEAEDFYRAIFVSTTDPHTTLLKVWLSGRAFKDYHSFGSEMRRKFVGYVHRMQHPSHLEAKESGDRGWITDCRVYPEHKAHSALRLFYYWDQTAEELTICRAMDHQEYERKGKLYYQDYKKAEPISALSQEGVLIVPLGTSPMVVTQTYTLLQNRENEAKLNISTVAVVYPGDNTTICNGVELITREFEKKNVEFMTYPIIGHVDCDTEAACQAYLSTLSMAIQTLQTKYPDKLIALSLSGGRQSMAALTFLVAQSLGIEQLYHTLITDIDLEAEIEKQSGIQHLESITRQERTERLFLEQYDQSKFELLTIPVIPIR